MWYNLSKVMKNPLTEEISFIVQDRTQIHGTVYIPKVANGFGVLCLHQLSLNRDSFSHFAMRLAALGFLVMVLDLRGHGESVTRDGETFSYETMLPADFNKIPGMDVEEAKEIFRDHYHIEPNNIGIVGASIGANAALIAEARDPRIAFAVALSPGLDFRGLQPEGDIAQVQKPVLLVASRDDDYSLNSATLLSNMIPAAEKQLNVYEKAGHGTVMMNSDAHIEEDVIAWIAKRVR